VGSAPAHGAGGAVGGDVVDLAALAEQGSRMVAESGLQLLVLGGRGAGAGPPGREAMFISSARISVAE